MKFLWEKLYAKLNRIDNSSIVNHFFRNYFPRTMKNLYLRNPIKFTTNWKSSRIKSTRIKLSMENYSLVRSKLFSVLSLSPLIRKINTKWNFSRNNIRCLSPLAYRRQNSEEKEGR